MSSAMAVKTAMEGQKVETVSVLGGRMPDL